jgi:hypothetical protein
LTMSQLNSTASLLKTRDGFVLHRKNSKHHA